MSLDFKKIENLIIKNQSKTKLVRIIIIYSSLKQKMENQDNQSWAFRKGLESNKLKLKALNKEYEKIMYLFNNSSIDFLIEKVNENVSIIERLEKNGMNMITQIYHSSLSGENSFFKELIHFKSRIELLMPIDSYLEEPVEFLKLIE